MYNTKELVIWHVYRMEYSVVNWNDTYEEF